MSTGVYYLEYFFKYGPGASYRFSIVCGEISFGYMENVYIEADPDFRNPDSMLTRKIIVKCEHGRIVATLYALDSPFQYLHRIDGPAEIIHDPINREKKIEEWYIHGMHMPYFGLVASAGHNQPDQRTVEEGLVEYSRHNSALIPYLLLYLKETFPFSKLITTMEAAEFLK